MTVEYPPIVVVVGTGRSGSVFLAGLLRDAFSLGIAGEPKFVVPAAQRVRRFDDLSTAASVLGFAGWLCATYPNCFRQVERRTGVVLSPDDVVRGLDQPTYRDIVYRYFGLVSEKIGCTRLAYRDPADLTRLAAVAAILPSARFIHIVRDGRDVALSYRGFDWGPTNLYAGARMWARGVRAAADQGAALSGRYLAIALEDLVTEPAQVGAQLGAFVPDATRAEVAQFVELASERRRAGPSQPWKSAMSASEARRCEEAAADQLCAYGYELATAPRRGATVFNTPYLVSDIARRAASHLRRR